MSKTETKKTPSATIKLDGNEAKSFETIKAHMTSTLPGINPTAAEVVRYALNLAVDHLVDATHSEAE